MHGVEALDLTLCRSRARLVVDSQLDPGEGAKGLGGADAEADGAPNGWLRRRTVAVEERDVGDHRRDVIVELERKGLGQTDVVITAGADVVKRRLTMVKACPSGPSGACSWKVCSAVSLKPGQASSSAGGVGVAPSICAQIWRTLLCSSLA